MLCLFSYTFYIYVFFESFRASDVQPTLLCFYGGYFDGAVYFVGILCVDGALGL